MPSSINAPKVPSQFSRRSLSRDALRAQPDWDYSEDPTIQNSLAKAERATEPVQKLQAQALKFDPDFPIWPQDRILAVQCQHQERLGVAAVEEMNSFFGLVQHQKFLKKGIREAAEAKKSVIKMHVHNSPFYERAAQRVAWRRVGREYRQYLLDFDVREAVAENPGRIVNHAHFEAAVQIPAPPPNLPVQQHIVFPLLIAQLLSIIPTFKEMKNLEKY